MHKSIIYKLESISSIEDLAGFVFGEYKVWSAFRKSFLEFGYSCKEFVDSILCYEEILGIQHGVARIDDLERIINKAKLNSNFRVEVFDLYDKYHLPASSYFNDLIKKDILSQAIIEKFTYISALTDKNFQNQSLDEKNISAYKIGKKELKEAETLSIFVSLENYSKDKINAAVCKLEQSITTIDNSKQESIDNLNEFRKEIEAKYEEHISSLKKAFEADIKVKAAVNYWSDRSERYEKKARNVIFFLIIVLIFISTSLYLFAFKYFDQSGLQSAFDDKHFKYILTGAFFTLFVWLIRVFLKVWLSNVHLHNDAAERVVMIQTYIALLADNSLPDKDDRGFVINSIFRPASDGMIKDDGMPNPIIELITKSR